MWHHDDQRSDIDDHWSCDQGPSGARARLLESAYRVCLAYELRKMGLQVEEEKPIPLVYEEIKLDCGFRADLIVEGMVVVELKAKEKLHPVEKAQVLSHLRLLKLQIGLLINFHELVLKNGIQRIANDYREDEEP